MEQKTSKAWFAPKRYGYGTGLPISWQGWLVFVLYLVIMGVAPLVIVLLPNPFVIVPSMLAVIVIATAAFFWVCAKKTEGGWCWRWRGKP